jgi:GyrI-like small molecule binding domain
MDETNGGTNHGTRSAAHTRPRGGLSLRPEVVTRADQPYVGLRDVVHMDTAGTVADRIPEVVGWVAARGLGPMGPPFLRYHAIDMGADLDVEAGVPVALPSSEAAAVAEDAQGPDAGAGPGTGDGGGEGLHAGTLPAGTYVVARYLGPPDGLADAARQVREWATGQGLTWDLRVEGAKELWGCRFESFLTDPQEEPDMAKWTTELAFRLAD